LKILAIIPARGGSKGLPKKNIQKLAGKPLLVHTIIAAKESKLINRIIVSTDDKEISKVATKSGVECPFIRPKKISGSNAKVLDVVKHVLKFLKKKESYMPDIVTILYPTAPFRTSKMIDKSVRILTSSNADIVVGVKKIKTHPYRSYLLKNNYLKPLRKDFLKYHQRQTFPPCYYPTGAIYTFFDKTLEKYENIYGPKIKPLITSEEELAPDIDSLFDLFINEMKIRYWKKYKKNFKSVR